MQALQAVKIDFHRLLRLRRSGPKQIIAQIFRLALRSFSITIPANRVRCWLTDISKGDAKCSDIPPWLKPLRQLP